MCTMQLTAVQIVLSTEYIRIFELADKLWPLRLKNRILISNKLIK
jgi:hypothetical protein